MAVQYPDAKFVGIDLSSRQVEMGQRAVRTLGVTNLDLRTASITDVSPDWGTFDYILCHGVYSWVPDAVQDAILNVCRTNLSPEGVGYVSYNTYPGWHMRGMLREIMCFHAARFTQPEEQVKEARLLLDFLTEACGGEKTPHALLLAQESQLLRQQSDSYLYHEHLEEFNTPCYFAEFAKKVKATGLQYLGDAALPSMFAIGYPPKVLATLQRLCRDHIQFEQYLDFVRNRMFRASLVCHAGVELNRTIDAGVIEDLHFASSAKRAAEQPATATAFTLDSGATVTTADPHLVAAVDALAAAWPGTLTFPQVAERVTTDTPAARGTLSGGLLQLMMNGAVVASAAPARCGNAVPDAPDVGALARHTATTEGWLPTFRHTVLRLDDFGKRVVPLLDGKNTQPAVLDQLMAQFRTGKLTLHHDGSRVRDEATARELLTKGLANLLETLRRGGALRA
jgi:methyltransferase-like protein/SAM-dependent methyltransferase